MTSMSATYLVLQQDGRRVRTLAARREEPLAEFSHQGLSAVPFAVLAGFAYQTLSVGFASRSSGGI